MIIRDESSLVSVIVPFYKNKEWLRQALTSVEQQTYKIVEVIVINDGSSEDLTDIEKDFPNFSFTKTINKGAGAARNLGIDLAKGYYTAFLDSDDIWSEDKIQKQVAFMQKHNFIWSHTDYLTFQDKKPKEESYISTVSQGYILPWMLISCRIATPCVMIQTSILKENNTMRFSTDYHVGEDSLMWIKIAENYPLGYLAEPFTKVRLRGSNAAYNPKLQLQSKAQFYDLIKNHPQWFSNKKQRIAIGLGFKMSKRVYNFGKKLNVLIKQNNKFEKTVFYMLYAGPYIYLKLVEKFLK